MYSFCVDIQPRIVALVLCIAAASGCGRPAEAPEREAFWSCDGVEFRVQPDENGVRVELPGYSAALAAAADDPQLFQNEGISVHFGDASAVLDMEGARHACEPKQWAGPWAAAAERGVAFRAVGQEPGWSIEVVPGRDLTLVLDYGDRTLTMPAPEPAPLDGGARGYQIEESAGRLVLVVIEPLTCFDVMSGEAFPETVTVAVGDDRYRGCGSTLGSE